MGNEGITAFLTLKTVQKPQIRGRLETQPETYYKYDEDWVEEDDEEDGEF